MKKYVGILVVSFLAVMLTGCASTKEAAEPARPVIIGAEGIPQPEWVYKTVTS